MGLFSFFHVILSFVLNHCLPETGKVLNFVYPICTSSESEVFVEFRSHDNQNNVVLLIPRRV